MGYYILILFGFLFEISGSFILAAEAIGLDKFERWIANLSRTRDEMMGKSERKGTTFLDPSRFIASLGAAAGGAFGYWISPHLPKWPAENLISAFIGGLAGVACGMLIYIGTIRTLKSIIFALRNIESRTRIHAVGLLGFGLLFLGFCLQFIGTLIDGLTR